MEPLSSSGNGKLRIRAGVLFTLAGFIIYLLGVEPGLFGADISPVTGFVQIGTFLFGLAIICLGGYLSMTALWNAQPMTIAAEIGMRLVATGFVIAVASGLADVFGFGSLQVPREPSFGAWQEVGVLIGEAVIALGFLLLMPFRQLRAK